MITKGDKAPSVLSLIALSVAIPLTLTNRAANDSSFTFDSSLTLATSAAEISAQNKLVIYGCVQLVNGIAYVLDALPEVRNRWQDREPRLLIVSCLADVLFCLMGVISQLVSKPSTAEAQFKGMSLNKGLWNLQWGTRVGLDGLSGVVKGVSAIRINQAQTKLERAEYDPVTNKQLQAKLDNVKAYFDVFKDENSVLLDVADTLLKLQEGMYELNNIIELDVETFNLQWAQKINEMKRDISSLFLHKELINEGNNKFEVEYFLDRVVPPHTLPLTLISSFRPNGKIREYCNGVMQLKSSVPTLSANSPNDIVETVKLVQKIEILDQNTLRAERRSVNDYLDTVDHDVKDVLDSLKKNITDQRYCTEVKALAPRIINELLALSSAFDDTIRELKVRQKTLQGVIGKVRTGQYQQIAQKLHVLRARCDELSQASSEAESAAREELKVQIANKDYWLKRIYILVLVSEIVHIVWSIVNYHAAGKDGDKETMANNVLDISPGLVDALIYLGIDAFLPPEQEADRKWTIGFTVFAFLDQLAYFALTLAIAFKK
ncbi:MAG: hypothetical protein JJ956_19565 [Pseudomonadales bacterium]|nr:hypothetical protein [Pseudomonadales bacterium]